MESVVPPQEPDTSAEERTLHRLWRIADKSNEVGRAVKHGVSGWTGSIPRGVRWFVVVGAYVVADALGAPLPSIADIPNVGGFFRLG